MDTSKQALIARVRELETENLALRERIDFLEGIPTLRAGIRGEMLISEIVRGRLTTHTAPHDVIVPDGRKLEVKFSRLNRPNPKSHSRRWSWNHPLGSTLAKDFDQILLIGVADPRYRDDYKDPHSPYVIFDVPRDRAAAMNQQGNHISITTDPNFGGYGTRRMLFSYFQTTVADLKDQYGIE